MKTTIVKYSLVVILGLTIIIQSGCFSSSNGIPYYTISDEFASYCWFQTGSSWVYQNDSTLDVGTITISDVNESKRFNPENTDYNYQAVEMFTSATAFDISRHELTAGDFAVEPGDMNSLLSDKR